jgi:Flp pilus assembly protein TadG
MSRVSGFPGEGGQLKIDHSNEGPSGALARGRRRFRRLRGDERGQAATEFALVLIPLLALVGGIIYFGIGLNYWLDMNRVANQGARWAAVNNWPPQCPRGSTVCTSSSPSTACSAVNAGGSKAMLQDVLRCAARNNPSVAICYPGKDPLGVGSAGPLRGDPVKVKLTAPYTFFFIRKVRITLTATASLRMEQNPTLITGEQLTC